MMGVAALCILLLTLSCYSHSLETHHFRSRRSQENLASSPNNCYTSKRQEFPFVDLRMPGVIPTGPDTYLCMAFSGPTSQDAYIVDFIPHASMDTVHHMLLFGCQTPVSTSSYWDCGSSQGTCEDQASIMYAWGRNAPPTKLPKDVGFKVGRNSGMSYFVLQMHYGNVSTFNNKHRDCSGLTVRMTSKPQPFIAGIYLLMSMDTVILPGKKVTNADVACDYLSYPIYPFAFRTHTHRLGKVVSGYRIRNGKWTLIGRQSPQLPQAFYPVNAHIDLKYKDTVAARCVFTGEGRTSKTYIGGTSDDEMCNFYIMYFMAREHAVPYMNCMEPGHRKLFQYIPAEANLPISVDQDRSPGDLYSLMSKLLGQSQDVVHVHTYDPGDVHRAQAELVAQIDSLMQNKDLGTPSSTLSFQTRGDPVLVRDRVHRFHQLQATAKSPHSKLLAEGQDHLKQVQKWPQTSLHLGQVSGLALDSDSNLVIFHRGSHYWEPDSFDIHNVYLQTALGFIQQSTILVVDPVNGNLIKASGRNMFYMPHGITLDKDGNYWVTDVALHQVMKLRGDGTDDKLLVLGVALHPGSDHHHFCKPTDVAIEPETGSIFISDGYCNSRIMKFSAHGLFLSEWGAGSWDRSSDKPFSIPHSLVFLPDKKELCVADRENGRIQCFTAEGEFVKEIQRDEFGGAVYAIGYSSAGDGLIFAVNGVHGQSSHPIRGFVIHYLTNDILDTFSPEIEKFQVPHDIAVSGDGSVYVADVISKSLFKFSSSRFHRSVKKAGIEVQELEEVEAFVQTKMRPEHSTSKSAPIIEKVIQLQQPEPQKTEEGEEEERKSTVKTIPGGGAVPAVITTLLLVPLLLVISIGVFVCWRRNNRCEVKSEPSAVGGILGKIRGKAVGGLNLGNFFATHKGYSRQGFDQLSTEGSDQERHDEDSSDSENEEYSALPPPPPPPQPPQSSS